MKIERKQAAQSFNIDSAFQEDLENFVVKYVEKFTYDVINNWDNFCIDSLYKEYQKYGYTKVLIISREDFKRFLLWALPKWNAMIKENKNEKDR